jgi:hypothetical protein
LIRLFVFHLTYHFGQIVTMNVSSHRSQAVMPKLVLAYHGR